MPRKMIYVETIKEAVQNLIPYLEDTSNTAHKAIYFDGWRGLAASAVLTAIAEDPPPSLLEKFNKIIHVNCSMWKSRRTLQRTIAQELKLPQRVMDIFDRHDKEDDFRGVGESSRDEIQDVGVEIHEALEEHKCLVVFHNGSDYTIDFNDFGIPQPDRWVGFVSKVLWTFRGRLRLNPGISKKVDNSHLFIYGNWDTLDWDYFIQMEAREIVGHRNKLCEVFGRCCLYLMSLYSQGGNMIDYDWVNHASNYWVCDGIIQGGQGDEAWVVAAALHQHIYREDYSSNALPSFGDEWKTHLKERWIHYKKEGFVVHHQSRSLFVVAVASISDPPFRPLPIYMFLGLDKLCVLKLCQCTFNFSSPPFCCCSSLRFLGLDGCKDLRVEECDKHNTPKMEVFRSLWVLDVCHTDLELDVTSHTTIQMVANIREVHIKKGRIWCHSFEWRKLRNLHKLRVIEPTSSWQTSRMDEFTDMVKMEFLDLSRNSTIQILPSLSAATSLKTLVLDGCVGLKSLGPEELPPSLESFSLDARPSGNQNEEAKITSISLAGCARLTKFRFCGLFPNLEELNLSGTLVKTLDLGDEVVHAPSLQQIILLGCLELHAIQWPEEGFPELMVLSIDSLVCYVHAKLQRAYATIYDIRFFQTLVLESNVEFCWKSTGFHLNLCVPCTNKVEEQSNKEKTDLGSSGQIPKSLIPNAYYDYMGVIVDNMMITDHEYNSDPQAQPLGSHVDFGDGIIFTGTESARVIKAIIFVMDTAKSLHVHDNSSITSIIPVNMMSIEDEELRWGHLKSCHVWRCPKMHTVFNTIYDYYCFEELVSFWAADLRMAHCIWSKGRTVDYKDMNSFAKLRSIHLFNCLRLKFVLPLSWFHTLSSLETIHISFCGVKQVFPVDQVFLAKIATDDGKGVLDFPNLKHIYLHQLFELQEICQAKIFAPILETIRVRGCWGLRRLPGVGRGIRPIVDCEKNWWEQLEWDGLKVDHDPSLFEPRHSGYYMMALPRVSVLR